MLPEYLFVFSPEFSLISKDNISQGNVRLFFALLSNIARESNAILLKYIGNDLIFISYLRESVYSYF